MIPGDPSKPSSREKSQPFRTGTLSPICGHGFIISRPSSTQLERGWKPLLFSPGLDLPLVLWLMSSWLLSCLLSLHKEEVIDHSFDRAAAE